MGWCGRAVPEKVDYVKETIHFQRRKNNPNSKHLSNFPIYFMPLLSMSSQVRQRLVEIQRDFLWGGGNLEWKSHLVRWEIVCFDKKKGVWGQVSFHPQ